jgi:hypothetical protein
MPSSGCIQFGIRLQSIPMMNANVIDSWFIKIHKVFYSIRFQLMITYSNFFE